MPFVPSPEQQSIFDAFLNSRDNIAVNALAGTGKTTTLVELARKLPASGSKLFCAFNRDIVKELQDRLEGTGMKAKTFHALGLEGLKKHLGAGQLSPNSGKYRELARDFIASDAGTPIRDAIGEAVKYVTREDDRAAQAREYGRLTEKLAVELLNFLRLTLTEWNDNAGCARLIAKYGLTDELDDEGIINAVIASVPGMMKIAETGVKALNIDFTDMIYWVVRWDVKLYQYSVVFVDECQDLSPMQRAMVKKVVWERGGRIVLVGDPNQAIYAFAGADADSFELSVKTFNAKVLPLTMTRRCAAIITHHAKMLVPAFRCPDDKERGKVVWIDENLLSGIAQAGDMILCRLKAPLVAAVLELIAADKAATILGAEIGKQLVAIIEKVEKLDGYTFGDIEKLFDRYEEQQVEKWMRKHDEARAEQVKDQMSAIRVVFERAKPTNVEALKQAIERLFSDDRANGIIILSTVHKSKGMEAKRVFILKPERLPLAFAGMSSADRQQEMNLNYVAVTRPKETLVYLTNPAFLKKHMQPPYAQTDFTTVMPDLPASLPAPAEEPTVADADALVLTDAQMDALPAPTWTPCDTDEEMLIPLCMDIPTKRDLLVADHDRTVYVMIRDGSRLTWVATHDFDHTGISYAYCYDHKNPDARGWRHLSWLELRTDTCVRDVDFEPKPFSKAWADYCAASGQELSPVGEKQPDALQQLKQIEPLAEETPVAEPEPFRATGDMKKDRDAYKAFHIAPVPNAPVNDRLMTLLDKLSVREIDTLVNVLNELRKQKEAAR